MRSLRLLPRVRCRENNAAFRPWPIASADSTSEGPVWFSTRELFLGAWLAEGRRHFFLLYARLRVAALPEILLFGAVTHHAGISHLGSLLGLGPGFLRHA